MAVTLGKRKRRVNPASGNQGAGERVNLGAEEEGDDGVRVEDVFRRHFEARFRPLKRAATAGSSEAEEGEGDAGDEEASEWSGFSEDEGGVEVVEHDGRLAGTASRVGRHEVKAFMSSKPPPSIPASTSGLSASAKKRNAPSTAEDEDSAENLKNDIALKRLLAESHLLDRTASSNGVQGLDPTGKNRHKALDLRFQALGSATSIYRQEKMPMSHRKGIVRKAQSREEKRRKEAKEAGIVLERRKGVRKEREKRERVVGGPAVGKFRAGMLTISKKDIASIEGHKERAGGRKTRR